jgi:hypothetical protein
MIIEGTVNPENQVLSEIAKELIKIRAELVDSNNKLELALKELDYIKNNMGRKERIYK